MKSGHQASAGKRPEGRAGRCWLPAATGARMARLPAGPSQTRSSGPAASARSPRQTSCPLSCFLWSSVGLPFTFFSADSAEYVARSRGLLTALREQHSLSGHCSATRDGHRAETDRRALGRTIRGGAAVDPVRRLRSFPTPEF